jgi:hypothetical protein
MTKFNIGDTAYVARAGQEQIWITCPECLGSGRLRVILGDDSEVSIHCECCSRGYEGSPGRMQTYAFIARTEEVTITGIESHLHDDVLRTHYKFSGCYFDDEKNLFATRLEALARAEQLREERTADETKRLKYKEKQHKTWAWNVHYWRSQIRRNREEIARYEARLAVAPKNIREADKKEEAL